MIDTSKQQSTHLWPSLCLHSLRRQHVIESRAFVKRESSLRFYSRAWVGASLGHRGNRFSYVKDNLRGVKKYSYFYQLWPFANMTSLCNYQANNHWESFQNFWINQLVQIMPPPFTSNVSLNKLLYTLTS